MIAEAPPPLPDVRRHHRSTSAHNSSETTPERVMTTIVSADPQIIGRHALAALRRFELQCARVMANRTRKSAVRWVNRGKQPFHIFGDDVDLEVDACPRPPPCREW